MKGSRWNVLAFTQNREPNRNRTQISTNNSTIEEEIDFYLNRATQASHENINLLDYWKTNHDKMPHLAALAREILCVPTTSASSERCFSASDSKTLLYSDRAEELIFCKQNYFALEPLIMSWKLRGSFNEHSLYHNPPIWLVWISLFRKINTAPPLPSVPVSAIFHFFSN